MIKIITLAILLISISPLGAQQVVDGDTLKKGDKFFRIFGIDAPEKKQLCSINKQEWACGLIAISELKKIITGKVLKCEKRDIDRYKRIVAVCFADGRDIGKIMVSSGWALAYREYSMDYVRDEETAKSKKLGIWSSEFVKPWQLRKNKN